MEYPALVINKSKLIKNITILQSLCERNKVKFCIVTKSFCANQQISRIFYDCGIRDFADTRIANLQKLGYNNAVTWLLRSPMMCEIKDAVKYANISLNSEIDTVKALSSEAKRQNKVHKVVLMVDLGDLREGVLPANALDLAQQTIKLSNIELFGIGTNLNCFGGVIPTDKNMSTLALIANEIETKLNIRLSVVSGGNSGSIHFLTNNNLNSKINHLRIGEAVLLGSETSFRQQIDGMNSDVFRFDAQIIELKKKSSLPIGEIGTNAFGQVPQFKNRGEMLRAIIACGKQDVDLGDLTPLNNEIEILGQSSDHTILNLTNCKKQYKIGDIISFSICYSSLLSLSTSQYVLKTIISD